MNMEKKYKMYSISEQGNPKAFTVFSTLKAAMINAKRRAKQWDRVYIVWGHKSPLYTHSGDFDKMDILAIFTKKGREK